VLSSNGVKHITMIFCLFVCLFVVSVLVSTPSCLDTDCFKSLPRVQLSIIIITFMKGQLRSLFLDAQDGVGPSISSSVVLCSFVLLVCIVVLILVFYLCLFSVCLVATFSGTVLFPLLCSVLLFFPLFSFPSNTNCHSSYDFVFNSL